MRQNEFRVSLQIAVILYVLYCVFYPEASGE